MPGTPLHWVTPVPEADAVAGLRDLNPSVAELTSEVIDPQGDLVANESACVRFRRYPALKVRRCPPVLDEGVVDGLDLRLAADDDDPVKLAEEIGGQLFRGLIGDVDTTSRRADST